MINNNFLLMITTGLAVVSTDAAALFTDGRYFLQAGKQMDHNWVLMKQGLPDVPTWQEYLVQVIIQFNFFRDNLVRSVYSDILFDHIDRIFLKNQESELTQR